MVAAASADEPPNKEETDVKASVLMRRAKQQIFIDS
jgi:hypothetical protein